VGHILPKMKVKDGPYNAGQLFLHSIFAYRGIVVCSYNVKTNAKPKPKEAIGTDAVVPFYQVLINRSDWQEMRIAHDQTSYLTQGTGREEKVLSVVNGMDCVSHDEILPYTLTADSESVANPQRIASPIDHDVFPRLFESVPSNTEDGLSYVIAKDQLPSQMASQCCLAPQAVYTEITNGVQVQIMTFYLGTNTIKSQQLSMHCWRYVTRIHNLEKRNITIRARRLSIYTLGKENHNVSGDHINGLHPCLSPQVPVFQFSSHINLLHPKGGYMYGKLIAENEDETTFEITIPTVPLEVWSEQSEQSENINI